MAIKKTRVLLVIVVLTSCPLVFIRNQTGCHDPVSVHQDEKPQKSLFDLYLCTQVYNEDPFLPEWLDHHLEVIRVKNICIIDVGSPIDPNIKSRYPVNYIRGKTLKQDFNQCRGCFTDIRPKDLLFIMDVDQFLNIRNSTYIRDVYHRYDRFFFPDIRFGYVYNKTAKLKPGSLRASNTYREPIQLLGEYDNPELYRTVFNCSVYGHRDICKPDLAKGMIKYGRIQRLRTHVQELIEGSKGAHWVSMKHIRLNHYFMRTKEDAELKGTKWKKPEYMQGSIAINTYLTMIFDDSILSSKALH